MMRQFTWHANGLRDQQSRNMGNGKEKEALHTECTAQPEVLKDENIYGTLSACGLFFIINIKQILYKYKYINKYYNRGKSCRRKENEQHIRDAATFWVLHIGR